MLNKNNLLLLASCQAGCRPLCLASTIRKLAALGHKQAILYCNRDWPFTWPEKREGCLKKGIVSKKKGDKVPKNFGTFGALFESPCFWNFSGTFVRPYSPNIWGKSAPNLLDWVYPKYPKMVMHKKCPET